MGIDSKLLQSDESQSEASVPYHKFVDIQS